MDAESEQAATYDSVAFRFVAANTHPHHNTLATFRRRFLKEVESLFVQVLMLAREMKLLKLGHIALDGTKVRANASPHKALSWAHANKIEAQLREESVRLGARMAKNGDGDALWRRICRPIAAAMGPKAAGAGRRSAILQPAILKSDS